MKIGTLISWKVFGQTYFNTSLVFLTKDFLWYVFMNKNTMKLFVYLILKKYNHCTVIRADICIEKMLYTYKDNNDLIISLWCIIEQLIPFSLEV